MLNDFKKFIMRGNLLDLALGFTVGAAFSTIAKSLVDDIIMPPVGWVFGNSDFADLFWVLEPGTPPPPYDTLQAAQESGAVTVNYGVFVNNVIAFLLVAVAMFVIIRMVNRIEDSLEEHFDDPPEPQDPGQKKCPWCRSKVPFKAIRCPYCTSDLSETGVNTDSAGEPATA